MILVFGSINLDTLYRLPRLPVPGSTVIGAMADVEPGGKGANQAVAAARDGATVAFAGAVGRDPMAEAALAGLIAAGVDLQRLVRTDRATGMAAICVDPQGQNQIAVAAGANLLARASQVADDALGPDTTVVLQMETDPAETASLIHRARAHGARIILNLAPAAELAMDALRAVDWLVVNEDEAEWLAKHLGTNAQAAALHDALGCGVVRTLGSQGVEAAWPGQTALLPALAVHVVDSTGAGDCFVGVFAAGLDRGADPVAALQRASVAAGLSCTRLGSQSAMPAASETEAALPQLPLTPPRHCPTTAPSPAEPP